MNLIDKMTKFANNQRTKQEYYYLHYPFASTHLRFLPIHNSVCE